VQKSAAIADNGHTARDISARMVGRDREVMMALTHKDDHHSILGNRAFLTPVMWILVLLGAYFVLADWHTVPSLIASTLAAIR
jgi:hypothetical protein